MRQLFDKKKTPFLRCVKITLADLKLKVSTVADGKSVNDFLLLIGITHIFIPNFTHNKLERMTIHAFHCGLQDEGGHQTNG